MREVRLRLANQMNLRGQCTPGALLDVASGCCSISCARGTGHRRSACPAVSLVPADSPELLPPSPLCPPPSSPLPTLLGEFCLCSQRPEGGPARPEATKPLARNEWTSRVFVFWGTFSPGLFFFTIFKHRRLFFKQIECVKQINIKKGKPTRPIHHTGSPEPQLAQTLADTQWPPRHHRTGRPHFLLPRERDF